MRKMATAFNTTVAALEDELTQLILEGLINARIDSHSKVSERISATAGRASSCAEVRNSPFLECSVAAFIGRVWYFQ